MKFSELLSGQLSYTVFHLSHWIRENWIAVLTLFLFTALLTVLIKRFPRSAGVFSGKLIVAFVTLLLLTKGTIFALERQLQTGLREREMPNVILLTIDTLRADHLSLYQYARTTSPNIDRFASSAVTFTNAIPVYTKTNQSFAGVFTGKNSYATGIGSKVASFLPTSNLTLAEMLKNAGYHTAGMTSNPNLSTYFNFNDGFDEYYEL